MQDRFFKVKDCERCGDILERVRIQSWFTEEVICLECSELEKKLRQKAREKGLGDLEGCGYVPRFNDERIMNYKVEWVGIREGYGIEQTKDEVDDYEVFKTFREAKRVAVERAKNDVEGARVGLSNTKRITKGDVE
jgi:hypothetical protein